MPDGGVIILDYVLNFKTPSDDPTVGGNVHFKLMRLNGSNVNPDRTNSFQTELNYLDPTTKEVYRPFSLRFVDLIEAGNTNNYKYLLVAVAGATSTQDSKYYLQSGKRTAVAIANVTPNNPSGDIANS
jgi:hypothetical protein